MAGFGVDRGSGSSSGNPDSTISAALIDAKGDLIVGSADDTPTRLAVGATNGLVLQVDSAEATGMKWGGLEPATDFVPLTTELYDLGTTSKKWVDLHLSGDANVGGDLVVDKAVSLRGDISPTQITGDQNDYNPTSLADSSTLRLSSNASRSITGLAGGADGRILVVHNVGSFAITLVKESSSSTAANRFAFGYTLQAGQALVLQYDSTSSRWRSLDNPEAFPKGWINGLTLAINSGDATNDIDIAVGEARDVTDAENLILATALTKRMDAAWAVGTNQGGLDGTESVAGTPDNDTWYYVFLIKRSDTGVVDVLFSESSSSPTMPTNYDYKRLIGVVRRGTAANVHFYQDGDWFRWQADRQVLNAGTSLTAAAVTISSAVPTTAAAFTVRGIIAQTSGGPADMTMSLVLQVAASVDFSTLVRHQIHTDAAESFISSGGEFTIPNTGAFNYRIDRANDSSRNASIWVTGFKLMR